MASPELILSEVVATQFGVQAHPPQPTPSLHSPGSNSSHHGSTHTPPPSDFSSASIPDVAERHPVYFFHDGNVDLVCQSDDSRIVFRVHGQRLVQHSPIMSGRLSHNELHRLPVFDGRPQIPWDDDPTEFSTLLEVLYKQVWVLGSFCTHLLSLFAGFRSGPIVHLFVNSLRFCGCQPNTRSTPSAMYSWLTCAPHIRLKRMQRALPRSTTTILGTLSLTPTRSSNCSMNAKWILLCRSPFTKHVRRVSSLSRTPTPPSNSLPFPSPKPSEGFVRSKNGNGSFPGASCSSTVSHTHRTGVDRLTSALRIPDRPYRMFCAPSILGLE